MPKSKLTAKLTAEQALAHIEAGNRDAANELCRRYLAETPIGDGCYNLALGRRQGQLRRLGLVLWGANWSTLAEAEP